MSSSISVRQKIIHIGQEARECRFERDWQWA